MTACRIVVERDSGNVSPSPTSTGAGDVRNRRTLHAFVETREGRGKKLLAPEKARVRQRSVEQNTTIGNHILLLTFMVHFGLYPKTIVLIGRLERHW
jgi:hypothetical protein